MSPQRIETRIVLIIINDNKLSYSPSKPTNVLVILLLFIVE